MAVKVEKKLKGITSKQKDPVPGVIVPDDAENINLTKAEFIAKKKKTNERLLKVKEYEASLKIEDKKGDDALKPLKK